MSRIQRITCATGLALMAVLASPPLWATDEISAVDARQGMEALGRVETLPAQPGPHWLWVNDPALWSMPDGRAYLLDADSGRWLGALSTGYSFSSLTLPGGYREIYSAETYYSRHTRGQRTDVITVYDTVTLTPQTEIVIPTKRASTLPRVYNAALTDDDRFMAVFNLTPASSLSIVDVARRHFAAEINIPGCSMAFAAGNRAFFSLCFNGAVLVTRLTADGRIERQDTVENLFDPAGGFITEHGVRTGNTWMFASVDGYIHELQLTGNTVAVGARWTLLNDGERAAQWRISGMQGLALHVMRAELYVLMHQGPRDSYEDPGVEVWVYDLESRARIRRIVLQQPALTMEVSADAAPLLVTVDAGAPVLDVYAAVAGRHLRRIEELGITPSLLQFPRRHDARDRSASGTSR